MFSTGPMFLTLEYMKYSKSPSGSAAIAESGAGGVWVVPDDVYSDDCGHSFFKHYEGSSWHGSDSWAILTLYAIIRSSFPIITFALGITLGHLGTLALQRQRLAAAKAPKPAKAAAVTRFAGVFLPGAGAKSHTV